MNATQITFLFMPLTRSVIKYIFKNIFFLIFLLCLQFFMRSAFSASSCKILERRSPITSGGPIRDRPEFTTLISFGMISH